MMNHKTVTSKDRIMLNEAKNVVAPGNGVFSQQMSAQERLCPKAQTRKPAFEESSTMEWSSPAVRRMRQLEDYSIKTDASMEEVAAGRYNIKTDASMNEVVADSSTMEWGSLSASLPQVAPKQMSAQERLCPKAETRKSAFNYPIRSHGSSPAADINTVSLSASLPQVAPKSFYKGNITSNSPLTPPFSPDEEVLKVKKDLEDSCICTRPRKLIFCSACRHTTTGRLRKICQVHPKELYLHDIDACPSCKETQVVLQEHDLPKGSDERSHVKDRKEEYKEKVVTKKGKRTWSEDNLGLQNKRIRRDGP